MDWVPTHTWGQAITIPQGDQVDIPLMDPDQWGLSPEVLGRIEDSQAYQLVRLIGQFTLWTDGFPMTNSNAGAVVMHLWPGLQDTSGVAPEVSVAGDQQLAVTNNEKFWWTRTVSAGSVGRFPWDDNDNFAIPFWGFMDHKINSWISGSMTPVISVSNVSFGPVGNNVFFLQKWRMLIGRTSN